jgi:putative ABC transport system permease protein
MMVIRLIWESLRFAVNALTQNLLRTVLSLAGVSIGIFLIIAVLTVVDSLERSIKESFKFLGAEVIYVQKWPWSTSPNYPWWRYLNRPYPDHREFRFLNENLTQATGITIMAIRGGTTVKRGSSSVGGINLFGASDGYDDVHDMDFASGRFFTELELNNALNVAIIGKNLRDGLFPGQNPLGREVKFKGLSFTVIGVLNEEGENLLSTPSSDENMIIPYRTMGKLYYLGKRRGVDSFIAVKGKEDDVGLLNLEYEIRGLLRRFRGLKPAQEDDFAINRPEMIANTIGGVFDIMTIVGAIIGGFSILVGAFGIANIMFVSVNERIGIIGIQKSLGAKNYFILFQFIFESVFLALVGGFIGLFLVFLGTFIPLGTLELVLNTKNVILAVGISTAVGVLSGIIPATMAARLDPVVAIRSN